MQTSSPEHLTGSEGPTGANSIQKGTHSFSCIRFISAMNILFGSRVGGAVVCPDERRQEEMRVVRGWGRGVFREAVSWGNSDVALVSSAHLIGNKRSHILSLSETLVCIPVARLSKVF